MHIGGRSMDDTISRQAAIERIKLQMDRPDAFGWWTRNDKIAEACYKIAIEILERLPSAEPETHDNARETHACDNERTETHDLISRKAAINAINSWFEKAKHPMNRGAYNNGELAAYSTAISEIENLPSAETFSYGHENDWIPASERLPEEAYPVIVTWKNDDPASYYQYILGKHYAGVAHYKHGKWYWYSSITEDVLMEYGRCDSEEFDEAIEVLAWMPLPKPASMEKD